MQNVKLPNLFFTSVPLLKYNNILSQVAKAPANRLGALLDPNEGHFGSQSEKRPQIEGRMRGEGTVLFLIS